MANTQSQFGFKHFGSVNGASPNYQLATRAIQSTLATAIGFGDPVQRITTTSPYITRGTNATTFPLEGIFQGCQYTPTGGGAPIWSPFWPGNTVASDAVAYVIDNPDATFLVAALSTAIGSGNIGSLVNFTNGTPSLVGQGFSIATVDQGTLAAAGGTAASALPFRVYGLYPGIGNGSDPTTSYNWVVVAFNNQVNRAFWGA